MPGTARRYFSQRKNGAPAIATQDFAYRLHNILADFARRGYFERLDMRVGCEDVISDELRRKMAIAFGRESRNMLPTESNLPSMGRDSIFDLIEFLSEYVSTSSLMRLHASLNHDAQIPDGLEEWRKSVNECLEQLNPPCRLTANGEIEILPPSAGLRHLVDAHASPSHDAQEKTDHACRLFLKRDATVHDRRSALKDLADVLEMLRNDLDASIGKKEADKLFDIANNYGIRHNNRKQKELDENYAQWFFYSTLSTIDLVARLGSKQQQDAAKPQA